VLSTISFELPFFRTRTKKGPFKIEGPFAISVGVAGCHSLLQIPYLQYFKYKNRGI